MTSTELMLHLFTSFIALDGGAVAGIVSSIAAVFSGVVVAYLGYRSNLKRDRIAARTQAEVAAQSAAIEQQKANAEIAKQQREMYSQLLTDLRGEVDRLRSHISRMQEHQDRQADRLARAQDVTNELRNSANTSQRQVMEMRDLVDRMQDRIDTLEAMLRQAGVTPPEASWVVGGAGRRTAPPNFHGLKEAGQEANPRLE